MSDRRNHSPGPWRVGADGITVILSDGQSVSVSDAATDRARANARLIASSPTLLKAAKLALLEFERISYQKRADSTVIAAIEEAVARAEGGA